MPHSCAAFDVLAFLCGWVEGLRDLDEALQEDRLFARDVRLGDWGGSSTACSHSGDGLRELLFTSSSLCFCPPSVSYSFRPSSCQYFDEVVNVKGMCHVATFTIAMLCSQIMVRCFKENSMVRRRRGVDAVRAR